MKRFVYWCISVFGGSVFADLVTLRGCHQALIRRHTELTRQLDDTTRQKLNLQAELQTTQAELQQLRATHSDLLNKVRTQTEADLVFTSLKIILAACQEKSTEELARQQLALQQQMRGIRSYPPELSALLANMIGHRPGPFGAAQCDP